MEKGFKINKCEKIINVNDTNEGYITFFLYVDDIPIVGSNDEMIRTLKICCILDLI